LGKDFVGRWLVWFVKKDVVLPHGMAKRLSTRLKRKASYKEKGKL